MRARSLFLPPSLPSRLLALSLEALLTLVTLLTGPSDIYKIVKMIMVKNYNPVIVFAFSKRECEGLALQMSKLEFNTDEERDMVDTVFNNAISSLSEDDRQLPQIDHILPLLKRGIGIHHGGLLPILKEVIEILFQEGLLKVLFATETFSIGLNMPAKTVVFTSVRKFDGRDFRNLSGGEYIQMSGRAGRRGLDDRGIVIMMTDEKLEPAAAKGMVKGQADRLDSAFHLGYNMILNLMRVEGLTPEYMLERSFYQFQNTASVPKLEDELRQLDEQRAAIVIPDEDNIADYYDLRQQLDILNRDLRDVLNHPTYALPFLQPGRLVRVKHDDLDFGWGVVVNYQKRVGAKGKPLAADEPPQNQYIVDVLLHVAKGTAPAPASVTGKNKHASPGNAMSTIRPCPTVTASGSSAGGAADEGEFAVVPVLLSTLDGISHIRIFLAKDLKPVEARNQALKSVKEVKRRFPGGIALLDPVENMGIVDEAFKKLLRVRRRSLSLSLVPCLLQKGALLSSSSLMTFLTLLFPPSSRRSRSSSRASCRTRCTATRRSPRCTTSTPPRRRSSSRSARPRRRSPRRTRSCTSTSCATASAPSGASALRPTTTSSSRRAASRARSRAATSSS